MNGRDFAAWRERMGFNRLQAAEALGLGRNQPQRYEEAEDEDVPHYIDLACRVIEGRGHPSARDMTSDEIAGDTAYALSRNPPDMRLKEIVAVTMHRGATRPFPQIHRYYVEWFDSNGLRDLPAEIEHRLFQGLKGAVIAEARKLERSGLGQVQAHAHFEELELLAIFTTDRAKALVDCWAAPIDLLHRFYDRSTKVPL